MQAQINISYEQLLSLVKQLPIDQWFRLKSEVEKQDKFSVKARSEMLTMLLNGPTFNKKQVNEIANARKEINEFRTR